MTDHPTRTTNTVRTKRMRIQSARPHHITRAQQSPPEQAVQTTRQSVWQVRFRWSDAP